MPYTTSLQKQYFDLANRLADQVIQLINAGQSKDEILDIISKRDFKKIILADPQFKKSFNDLNILYVTTLKGMDRFADISPQALAALTRLNKDTFMNKLAFDLSNNLKRGITTGILAGLSKHDIINSITADLRPDQIETLVSTALNNYTASINSLMADQLPENTAYVYRGPMDSRTRDICLQFAAMSPLSRKDINAMLSGGFLNRGGFNCRHQWTPQVKDQAFFFPKEAKKIAIDKGVQIG